MKFIQLNHHWNAEPNAPCPEIVVDGADVVLAFYLNAFIYPQFKEGDFGLLRFVNASRYRLGETNDEGWYLGQCRYSKLAPAWGKFYEISGDLPPENEPKDWISLKHAAATSRQFLFYLRDNTFECDAESWSFSHAQQGVAPAKLAFASLRQFFR